MTGCLGVLLFAKFLHGTVSSNSNRILLGSYLAGQIEGDGSIIVPTGDNRKAYPLIKICFHLSDLPQAELIVKVLGGGRIYHQRGNWIVLVTQDLATLKVLVNQINGYMRTPKVEALHRLIMVK